MDNRVVHQFQRIVNSIGRLTTGTPLEGMAVRVRETEESDRLAFSTTAPDGSEPFQGYRGILLYALEGWNDQSLDQRLYESADLSVQGLLNGPTFTERDENPHTEKVFVADAGRDLPDCTRCKAFNREIELQLLCLNMMSREAASLSRNAAEQNLQHFVDVLRSFLDLKHELSGTKAAFGDHRLLHRPVM